jgi:hypothetical protein
MNLKEENRVIKAIKGSIREWGILDTGTLEVHGNLDRISFELEDEDAYNDLKDLSYDAWASVIVDANKALNKKHPNYLDEHYGCTVSIYLWDHEN